jgi:collagen type I alpha
MTGSTINSYLTIGVTIGVDGYTSPLTVNPVSFGGAPPNPPTITGGFIAASNPGGAGVYANVAGASILNEGIIYGAGDAPGITNPTGNGVDVFGGGTLTNSGRIGGGRGTAGAGSGVSLSSSALFNNGEIRGGYYGGTGVAATNSYVLNTTQIYGGLKGAATSAVGIVLTASTLINQGTVSAGYPGGAAGAELYAGSSLTNTGKIIGAANGWALYVASGSVLNEAAGRIQPSETVGKGVALLSGGTLTNQGTIGLPPNYESVGTAGGAGVSLAAGAVLTNTGVIAGSGASGTSAGGTGVIDTNDSFSNAGTIVGGSGYGVAPETAGFDTVPGHGGVGVSLTGGSVTNAGLIGGGEAFGAGTSGAIGGAGVLVVTGSLTNNGTIKGGGGAPNTTALGGAGIVLLAGSVVNNLIVSGGNLNGNLGVGADISGGSLTNAGAISGSDGVDVSAGAAAGTYIDNTDTIAGDNADGVSLASATTVVNSGQISGNTNAVVLTAGGSVTNTQTGMLTAGSAAILATVAATIVNLGSILSGNGVAVSLSGGGSLVNGSPTDTTAKIGGGETGAGVALIGGSLANYGVVLAGYGSPVTAATGALLTSVSGTNAGTITGGAGAAGHGAVDFGTGDVGYTGGFGVVLTNSTLTNTGILAGGVGGEGGYGVYDSAVAGNGGTGGVGAVLNGGSLGNTGTVEGGAGGEGGNHGINSSEIPNNPSGFGGGGASVAAGTLHNTGAVIGGAVTGGLGGGYGVALTGGALVNGGMLTGGSGEVGGTAGVGLIETTGTASNTGTIMGGGGVYNVRGGGGVSLTGGGLINTGLIEGGAGAGAFYSTNGGTGLYLSGATATTSGRIIGGAEGAGQLNEFGAQGAAVQFGSAAATLIVDPGAVFTGQVIGNNAVTDTLTLAQGLGPGTLEMGGSFTSIADIQFDPGAVWTLRGSLAPLASGQAIGGFAPGNTIVVEGFAETGYSFVPGTGLELSGGGNPTLAIAGNFSTQNFQVSTDGTNTTVTVECFAAGTRIATPDGEIAVEALREGDLVRLHDGGVAPVTWIGHRRIDCARHPAPKQVWPVRVAADAFGPGLPRRDLFISPDHAVFAAGVLIPVKYLINGTSIAQVVAAELHYFHVELPAHNVLLAEGLPVESYLDCGDRAKFFGGNVTELHPNFAARAWEMKGCAELVLHGEKLDAVRASIASAARPAMPQVTAG